MSIMGAILIVGQFVLAALFVLAIVGFVSLLAYDGYDNRRRAAAEEAPAEVVQYEPRTSVNASTAETSQLSA
jgi:hypothetical protein